MMFFRVKISNATNRFLTHKLKHSEQKKLYNQNQQNAGITSDGGKNASHRQTTSRRTVKIAMENLCEILQRQTTAVVDDTRPGLCTR